MRVTLLALLMLGVAIWSSEASSNNGGVRYSTPSAQVRINWNGNNDNDGDNDGNWGSYGQRSGAPSIRGWAPSSVKYGPPAPSSSYGPPRRQLVHVVRRPIYGKDSSSSEEAADGGDGDKDTMDAGDNDNNNDNKDANDNMDNAAQDGGDGNQAEISIKTVPGKDGKVQKEIDIELKIDGESKTMGSKDALSNLMDLLRSLGEATGGAASTDAAIEAAAEKKEAAVELAEMAAEVAADPKEAAAEATVAASAGAAGAAVASGSAAGAAVASGSAGGATSTMVDLRTADLADIADILKANNINSDLASIIEFARNELGAASKTELEVVQGGAVIGLTENADAKAEAAMEAAAEAQEATNAGAAEAKVEAGTAAEAATGTAAGVAEGTMMVEAGGIEATGAVDAMVETGGAEAEVQVDTGAVEGGLATELTAPEVDAQQGEAIASNWDREMAKAKKGGRKRPSYDGFAESFLRFDWGQDDRKNDRSSAIKLTKSKIRTSGKTYTARIEPTYDVPSREIGIDHEALDQLDLDIPEIDVSAETRVPVYETPIVKEYRAPLYRESRPVVRKGSSYSHRTVEPTYRYIPVGHTRTVVKKPVKTVVHQFRPAPVQYYALPVQTVKKTHRRVVYRRPKPELRLVKEVRRPSYSSAPLVDFDDLW